ncbi:MAG: glycerol-3-phosphate 1-O-acyltransferase PlsY [Trueperaceae bacterium]|nr:glycerol-3-phosphate 1-O-acyltransferase PlsY [Trueperaceae bacterium]MCW5819552.1 glycerol-3-phosphate 1-O-acyltransferase PlsY [Trueperaceae bacterium]
MLDVLLAAITIVVAYFLGTIPSGYLVAKVRGVNIQQVGSGNIGATNVLRALGVVPAVIVVILDPLKGALATLLPGIVGLGPWVTALAGLAAVLGNDFNVLLRMKGGKGIATSIGVFMVIDPLTTLMCLVLGVFTILLSRYVSLGSLVGMAALPLFVIVQGEYIGPRLLLAAALLGLAVYRHSSNIQRLVAGNERRLGDRSAKS